jgi:hypothetical protein
MRGKRLRTAGEPRRFSTRRLYLFVIFNSIHAPKVFDAAEAWAIIVLPTKVVVLIEVYTPAILARHAHIKRMVLLR